MEYKQHITIVEDWPKEGVQFKDITPLMANGEAFKSAVDDIITYAKEKKVDIIVGPEARGFIIGCPVAYALGIGFIPVRKAGKLPREVIEIDYGLEYGKNVLTIHKDAIQKGQRVLITRSEEHTSELQSRGHLVCRLLLEKKKIKMKKTEHAL